MAHKILSPLKKIPYQVHQLAFYKKACDIRYGKVRSEMFDLYPSSVFGFPRCVSAIAYDDIKQLVAVGTEEGAIRIFGDEGIEFQAVQKDFVGITKLMFLPNEGRLISITSDNAVHLWELDDSPESLKWLQVKTLNICDSNGYTITASCISYDNKFLYLGTFNATIIKVRLRDWVREQEEFNKEKISDAVDINLQKSLKFGAVVSLQPHPINGKHLLIGYTDGFAAIADLTDYVLVKVTHLMLWQQELTNCCWLRDGTEVVTTYTDGSFINWPIGHGDGSFLKTKSPPTVPYGPLPCLPITKLILKTTKNGQLIIFTGGLPKDSCSDKFTISIFSEQEKVCFSLQSRVIDFFTIDRYSVINNFLCETSIELGRSNSPQPAFNDQEDEPCLLLILTDLELIAVDLEKQGWPRVHLPYLSVLNAVAPITKIEHVFKVPSWIMDQLKNTSLYLHEWPIKGGVDLRSTEKFESLQQDGHLLITGHVNGMAVIWQTNYGSVMKKLAVVCTSELYEVGNNSPNDANADSDWPAFRVLSSIDSCSYTDPRLAITSLSLVFGPTSCHLLIGGAGGQFSLWDFVQPNDEDSLSKVNLADCLVSVSLNKNATSGSDILKAFNNVVSYRPGFQPQILLQVEPIGSITTAALQPTWNLLAVGTRHGFIVLHIVNKAIIYTDTSFVKTANRSVTRSSSRRFKASMRNSFRKLKQLRISGQSNNSSHPIQYTPILSKDLAVFDDVLPKTVINHDADEDDEDGEDHPEVFQNDDNDEPDNPTGESNHIRCLMFSYTFINKVSHPEAVLLVGCQSGHVFLYSINWTANKLSPTLNNHHHSHAVPHEEQSSTLAVPSQVEPTVDNLSSVNYSDSNQVSMELHKDISMKRNSPVIALEVFDLLKQSPLPPCVGESAHTTILPASHSATSQKSFVSPSLNLLSSHASPPSPPQPQPPTTTHSVKRKGSSISSRRPIKSQSSGNLLDRRSRSVSKDRSGMKEEHHGLLVCTEEQVKLFSLPHFTPKYKYRITYSSNSTQSSPKKSVDSNKSCDRKVYRCGIQRFLHYCSRRNTKVVKYDLVLSVRDGTCMVLSLPHLHKQLTSKIMLEQGQHMLVCRGEGSGLIYERDNCQLQVLELSKHLEATSYTARCTLQLEEGMRPQKLSALEQASLEAQLKAKHAEEDAKREIDRVKELERQAAKSAIFQAVDKLNSLSEESSIFMNRGSHIGDATIDSIKEIMMSGQGTVTVKMYESTCQKRTTVTDGQVTTLTHEREEVDGRVTKEDISKVVGGDTPASTRAAGQVEKPRPTVIYY